MRTLHVYITRQVLVTTMMTVAVFTFVLLLGNILKEVFSLLFSDRATLPLILKAIGLLIPFVLVFALPMGMLTAMLLAFGRLSAERELLAMRGGGISLVALISPLLLLAAAFSVVCLAINLDLAPRCRFHYKNLAFDLSNQRPDTILAEGCFIKDIVPYIIYVDKIKDGQMHDLLVSRLDTNLNAVVDNIRAKTALLERLPGTNEFLLRLFESSGAALQENGLWQPIPYVGETSFKISIPSRPPRSPKLNEMTFLQLRAELERLEAAQQHLGPISVASPEQLREQLKQAQQTPVDLTCPLRVEMHRQLSFSFACIGFSLVGIPLGVRGHRKETSVGIAVALVLVLLYYSFFIMASSLATRAHLYPYLICWIPTLLFQVIGAVLLWRVNRR